MEIYTTKSNLFFLKKKIIIFVAYERTLLAEFARLFDDYAATTTSSSSIRHRILHCTLPPTLPPILALALSHSSRFFLRFRRLRRGCMVVGW